MTTASPMPLSRRRVGMGPSELVDGVPPYLVDPLETWFLGWIEARHAFPTTLGVQLRLVWETPALVVSSGFAGACALKLWRAAADVGEQKVLDLIDLALQGPRPSTDFRVADRAMRVRELAGILSEGGSIWRPSERGDCLEQVVSDGARLALASATAAATAVGSTAAQHLGDAWREAYGRRPDATKAYSEAVKAVEAAAIPVVVPADNRATLGKVLGELRVHGPSFAFTIAPGDIAPVVAVADALWTGQTDRHSPVVPVTLEAARAAVGLAAMLVDWFSTGRIRRR